MQLAASLFRAVGGMSTDTVNYCYTEISCYGAKIPAESTGELLMTKELCCRGVHGESWGGKDNQCETCLTETVNNTYLPVQASGKYITQRVAMIDKVFERYDTYDVAISLQSVWILYCIEIEELIVTV